MNILWILNKYVDGSSLSRYYPDFQKFVEEEVAKSGHRIYFAFVSEAMKAMAKTENNLFFSQSKISVKDPAEEANRLEKEYQFTFKQAYFPDQIQVSKSQDNRKIHLSEKEFNQLDRLIPKFLFLEKVIEEKKIDIVFCDQSSEVEMEFGRTICFARNKIFMRQSDSFLGRCVYYRQFEFGREQLARPTLDSKVTREFAREFVDDFVKNNRLPYLPRPTVPTNIKEYYLPRLLRFYRYPQFVKTELLSPYYWFEQHILKPMIEDKFDMTKPYLFFGFHLPIESTIVLRALPYASQISLFESISRVLPYGHYLYVREHPYWRQYFPLTFMMKLKALPNIRVISPKIPISKVLQSCRGVITYNATTGIEALMYGKPVLSFAPNVYYGYHPAVDFCSNLYELGPKLVKLVNTRVDKNDTYQYIYDMFRSTSLISIYAGTFLSTKDSHDKASVFTKELLASIEYFLKNELRTCSRS